MKKINDILILLGYKSYLIYTHVQCPKMYKCRRKQGSVWKRMPFCW